jgi:hypothetical protein
MRALLTLGTAAAIAGALSFTGVANAAETVSLGRNVASTATFAEKTAEQPMAVRVAVRDAVKQLVVTAGPKPDEVIAAIDTVFTACRPADGAPKAEGWSCPAKEETYSALLEVRGVIVALLDSPAPASVNSSGQAAFSSFPVTTAGGSYYTDLTEKN